MTARHRAPKNRSVLSAIALASALTTALSSTALADPTPSPQVPQRVSPSPQVPQRITPQPIPQPIVQAAPSLQAAAQPITTTTYQPQTVIVDNRPIVVENKIIQETSPGLVILDPEVQAKIPPQQLADVIAGNIRATDVPVLVEAGQKAAAAGAALAIPVTGLTTVGGAVIGGAPGAAIGGTAGAVGGAALGAGIGAVGGAAAGAAAGAGAGGAILGIAGTAIATPIGLIIVPFIPFVPGVAAGTVAAGIGAVGGGLLGAAVGLPVGTVGGATIGAATGGTLGAVAGGAPGALAGGALGATVGGTGAAVLGAGAAAATTPEFGTTINRIAGDVVWDLEDQSRINEGLDPLVGTKPGGPQQPSIVDQGIIPTPSQIAGLENLTTNPQEFINETVIPEVNKQVDTATQNVANQAQEFINSVTPKLPA